MSDTENNEEGEGGSPPAAVIPAAVAVEPRLVRMSLRPPPRFTAKGDLDLWLKRFEMYARQANIPVDQWVKELLSLLEDEPFGVVSRQGLENSADYGTVRDCLRQYYAPAGSEMEWQFKLQSRIQKPGESLCEFSGALRVLADKPYPRWPPEQRAELLRNQFIQGVRSPSIQLRLMKDVPATLDDALRIASQQETVETAQKRLLQERPHPEAAAITEDPVIERSQSPSPIAVASTASGTRPTVTSQRDQMIDTLSKQVKELSEQLSRLQAGRGQQRARTKDVTCWECGRRGHIRRDCPRIGDTGSRHREANSRRSRPLN